MIKQDLPRYDTPSQDESLQGKSTQDAASQNVSGQDADKCDALIPGEIKQAVSGQNATRQVEPGPYDDIIDLPHPDPVTHPRMSQENRAAQFAPFAALTGHSTAVKETARLTEERRELDENTLALLDMKLALLRDALTEQPEVTVTHFIQDSKKEGGRYCTTTQTLKKINDYEQSLVFANGDKVLLADIVDIESTLFKSLFL